MHRNMKPGLYRMLVDQAPDAIMLFDRQGIVRVWNQRANEIFGYGADEILGKSFGTIIRHDFQELHWQEIHDAVLLHHTECGSKPMATRTLHKDGRKRYVEFAFSVVFDESAHVVGFMASARDNTELYLAQRVALKAEGDLHKNPPPMGRQR